MQPPRLESVANHREANTYSLLLVALLERGAPMTLAEVAVRFEAAGIAERVDALMSLQRCKPGRPPVYRDGDRYYLDPHDDELDLWLFRLGLRPPKVSRPAPAPRAQSVLATPDVALTLEELDEAWKDGNLMHWTSQRLVLAVLDAHAGALSPAAVVAVLDARTRWHRVNDQSAKFKRRGSAVRLLDDGRWALEPAVTEPLRQARSAVRERIAQVRRDAALRGDPAVLEANLAEVARRRAAHGAELATLSRALVVVFPPRSPQFAVLVDVGEHTLQTYSAAQFDELRSVLSGYAVVGGIDVRASLRALGFEPGERRLAELGPPQKTKQINQRGRTLKITTALLVQGSCGISQPFGAAGKLAQYLEAGERTKLVRRLEADAKSLYALYEYGRLHGALRLRWGFLDECIPAPWVHRDEQRLYDLKKSALAMGMPLEVVVGSAPGWGEPWSRVRFAHVEHDPQAHRTWLVDDEGQLIDDLDVQRARLSVSVH